MDASVSVSTAATAVGAALATSLGLLLLVGSADSREEDLPRTTVPPIDGVARTLLTKIPRGWPRFIGNTPMVRIASVSEETGCEILGKAEMWNPCGSSKDRIALRAVCDAIACGKLRPGGTVIEGTSGSTGISLARLCRFLGLRCEVFVQDDASADKIASLERSGATVVKVKAQSIVSSEHYVNQARRRGLDPGCFFVDQFETCSNLRAHEDTTGPEILQQTRGRVDAFVMGAGTGGMLAGVSRFLKRRLKPEDATSSKAPPPTDGDDLASRLRAAISRSGVAVVLADVTGSALYHRVQHGVAYATQQSERRVRRHRYDTIVEGIGLDRVTSNMRRALVDAAQLVDDRDAVDMSRRLARDDGLFVGSTSAVHVEAARRVALALGPGHTIVTVLCDSGERHTSRFWSDEFLRSCGILTE
jgi:cysteine synthase